MEMNRDLNSIQEVRNLIQKAKEAQKKFVLLEEPIRNKIIKEMADVAYVERKILAKMAVEDTGFGKYEDKIIKNEVASKVLYEYIKDMKTMGIINEDKEKKMMEIAVPIGVIAALVPSTNATSTTIYKALISLKAGNAVVFSPHPSALRCICKTAELLNDAAVKAGAPDGLVTCMTIPTIEGTNELMRHKDVSLILATGGSAMVKAAYSSGTPALGVGPGNVPAFIHRTANISLAVKRILASKTFDNGTICASEQAIVTENYIKDGVKQELKKQGAYFLVGDEIDKVANTIQRPDGRLNAEIVGQSAQKIAEMAGIKVPEGIRVLVCEEKGVGKDYPFSQEKLSPILAFYSEKNWETACERCIELLEYGGLGHSLVIHSECEEAIMEFALRKPVSRILVNTPSAQGAVGATTNLAPSFTLGCGAVGGSATSDNVTPLNLINLRRVAYGIREVEDLKKEENCREEQNCKVEFEGIDVDVIAKMVLEKLKNI